MTEVNDGYDTYYAERLWQSAPGRLPHGRHRQLRRPPARCGNSSTASARRWPWSGGASTSCGRISRSKPATTGSSRTSATSSARTSSPTSTPARSASTSPRPSTTGAARAPWRSWRSWRWTSRAGPRVICEAFRRLARTRHGLDPAIGPAVLPAGEPGRGGPVAAGRGTDRPADRQPGRRASPTCDPAMAPRSQAPHSTRASTRPTSGPAAARWVTSGSPSCWCSSGG